MPKTKLSKIKGSVSRNFNPNSHADHLGTYIDKWLINKFSQVLQIKRFFLTFNILIALVLILAIVQLIGLNNYYTTQQFATELYQSLGFVSK